MNASLSSQTSTKKPSLLRKAGILSLLLLCIILFFTTPLPNSSAPRWTLLFEPTFNENFVNEIWFGIELPPASFTGERLITSLVGALFVFSAFCVGSFLLMFLKSSLSFNRLEQILFSTGTGLIVSSTLFLTLGLLGKGNACIFPYILGVIVLWTVRKLYISMKFRWRQQVFHEKPDAVMKNQETSQVLVPSRFERFVWICQLILITLFSSFYLFAASQPIFEYDAVEYHLQGAREIFESGLLAFSHNNVYLNMPLGAEMFYVVGFDLARDLGYQAADVLRLGSLIGKAVVTSFVFLTALGLFSFCQRFLCNPSAGLWSAIVFLSFPGVFEVYVSGLNDCLLSFSSLCIIYLFLYRITICKIFASTSTASICISCLLGVFAGFAIAVKYTGVVFILIPSAMLLTYIELKRKSCAHYFNVHNNDNQTTLIGTIQKSSSLNVFEKPVKTNQIYFALLIFVTVSFLIGGGWYLRNLAATHNPVYPLAYHIFGDSTLQWNDSIDARWRHAHSSNDFTLSGYKNAIGSSLWRDAFASPFFILSAFGLLVVLSKNAVKVIFKSVQQERTKIFTDRLLLSLYILTLCYWIGWFFFTHRLTRFLLPIAPIVGLTIGIWLFELIRKYDLFTKNVFVFSTFLCLLYSGLMIDIFSQGRMAPLRALENDVNRFSRESIYFNAHPELFCDNANDSEQVNSKSRSSKKLLLIGDAQAFTYHIPIVYSTCWNDSPFISFIDGSVEKNEQNQITSIIFPKKIRKALADANIEYILVDYSELARFRSKGNYGYNNPEITEALFKLLQDADVITPITINEENEEKSNRRQVFRVCNSM